MRPGPLAQFDASPTLRLQRIPWIGRHFRGGSFPAFPKNVEYGDIRRGLPVSNDSCRAVYCSHVLEHLALQDLRTAFQNTRSLLRKNGIFRFVIPDLQALAQDYIASTEAGAAMRFMEQSCLG